MDLSKEKCVPCEGGVAPLARGEAEAMLGESRLVGWSLDAGVKHISRQFEFKDFKQALGFVNQVGAVAEAEGHHPDIHLTDYCRVTITLSTHAIGGLSHNDFIVAIKINNLTLFSNSRE